MAISNPYKPAHVPTDAHFNIFITKRVCSSNIHCSERWDRFCWKLIYMKQWCTYCNRLTTVLFNQNILEMTIFRPSFTILPFLPIWGRDYGNTAPNLTLKSCEDIHKYIPRNMRKVSRNTHLHRYQKLWNWSNFVAAKRRLPAILYPETLPFVPRDLTQLICTQRRMGRWPPWFIN